MQIKKQSWHYRLVNFLFNGPSENLCNYFWQVIFSIFTVLVFTLVLPFCFGMVFYTGFDSAKELLDSFNTLAFFPLVLLTGYISIILIGSFSFSLVFLCEQLKNFDKSKEYKVKKPNILIEYYKAKKGKYCSKIDFIDKD